MALGTFLILISLSGSLFSTSLATTPCTGTVLPQAAPPPPGSDGPLRLGGIVKTSKQTDCKDDKGCFPGDAGVEMYTGEVKLMKDLQIGDKVAVGGGLFSEVYAFGHKSADVISEFVQIHTETDILELTAGHFVPVHVHGKLIYKRAAELKLGNTLFTNSGLSTVKEVSKVEKLGLYNPLTLSGNILVNNVVASVHSEWFLDSLFDALGVSEYLPYAYQTLLAPVRVLYKVGGDKLYSTGYALLDSAVNVADFGTKYGGSIALGFALVAIGFATMSF